MIFRTAELTSGSCLTVLVVECEPLLAFDLLDELSMLGHEGVGPVKAVRDVMAAREERPIDLALVDLNLLDGSGIDVVRYLGVHGIPYAFLTVIPEALTLDFGGALGVIGKRCRTEELRQALCIFAGSRWVNGKTNSRPSVLLGLPAEEGLHPERNSQGRSGVTREENTQLNLQGKRILLMESAGEVRDRFGRELQRIGAAVLGPAESAIAALELIYGEPPDAGVLDARLDAETSFAVAELLWQEAVPFVFTTSGTALHMPPEFLGRRLGKRTTVTDIADALFGCSNGTRSFDQNDARSPRPGTARRWLSFVEDAD